MLQRWALALVLVLVVTTLRSIANHEENLTKASSESRIIGGHQLPLPPATLPYICSVRQQDVHRCSATILNPRWLLTSGSCVYDRPALESIAVVCGVRMYRTVAEMALHPSFSTSPIRNDLALLMLRKPLNFTNNVQPIPLYDRMELPGASCGRATIVGFDGFNSIRATNWWNPSLQMAKVGILSSDECRERLPGPFLAAFLTEANVCTDNGPTDSSICAGDSGAPVLIATSWRQTYSLLAIASWTVAPCGAGPSVHVRVAPHLDWILGVISTHM